MLLTPAHDVNAIARFLLGVVGRGTFPTQEFADGQESCAFLFNDLLASDDDGETVATWILTADARTYSPYGAFGIRPEMTEDGAPSASNVIVTESEQTWYHFPDIGVAAMPMAVLRDYSAGKGWAWSTQEVTDGLAASARDIANLGEEQHAVLVIGHPTDQPNRAQGVAVAGIDMRGGGPTLLGAVDRATSRGLPAALTGLCSSAPPRVMVSGASRQREHVAVLEAVPAGRKAGRLVQSHVAAHSARLKPVTGPGGQRAVGGVPKQPVAFQDRENGIGRAGHHRRGLIRGGPGIELEVGRPRGGEQPAGAGNREIAAQPDDDVHPVGERLIPDDLVVVHD